MNALEAWEATHVAEAQELWERISDAQVRINDAAKRGKTHIRVNCAAGDVGETRALFRNSVYHGKGNAKRITEHFLALGFVVGAPDPVLGHWTIKISWSE